MAHVNGYTQPSLQDLHHLIVAHGGGFLQYLDGKTAVTHIIASSLTPKKAVEFRRYRIVKPAWVVESVKAGRLLPWNEFRLLDKGKDQKLLGFDQGKIVSVAGQERKGYREQSDASWYTAQLRGSAAPSNALSSQLALQRPRTPENPMDEASSRQAGGSSPAKDVWSRSSEYKARSLATPPTTSPSSVRRKRTPENPQIGDVEDDDQFCFEPDEKNGHNARPEDSKRESPNTKLTAEQHNAILLADPKVRRSTVVDPNFLEQYYRESRLHHLSTWKAELKSQMQALALEKSSQAPLNLPRGARRYVLHVDFDSFFAAVSLKKHPQWAAGPVAVAHTSGGGSEIASCNYPAREFGIRNGMWMKQAQQLCPELKVLPYDFPAYEEASRAFYDAILSVGGTVQSVSIDEALVDVSAICANLDGEDKSMRREQSEADDIAQRIRNEVKERTGCNVSVGIGGNILLAKLALRKAKPAGQHQIRPGEVSDFIGMLPVRDLPGVAGSISSKLEELGVQLVRDIRRLSRERLAQALGPKTGERLWEYSKGVDRTQVGEQVVRKSVSAEVNWGVRFENQEQAHEFIENLCGELGKRLVKEHVKGKHFTMKIMRRSADAPYDPPKYLGHGKCDVYNKSAVFGVATNSPDMLAREALSILKGFGFSPGELRGIGMQMTKLEPMKSGGDSSQPQLQFKAVDKRPRSATKIVEEDPIQDDPVTPQKHERSSRIPFGPHELNRSTPSRKPLNTLGTQFLLPTQVDAKVLEELPAAIRSKLLQRARPSSPSPAPEKTNLKGDNDPRERAAGMPAFTALPAATQLDPEILAALPDDVAAEVLAHYLNEPSAPQTTKQAHLIHSPSPQQRQSIISVPARKAPPPPVKRGRGRPPKSAMLAAAAAATSKDKSGATLRQASFLTKEKPPRSEHSGHGAGKSEVPEGQGEAQQLDPEFLKALPEDIRAEVIREHRREQAAAEKRHPRREHRAGVVEPAAVERPPPAPPRTKRKVLRIPRPHRPKFTPQRLHVPADVRSAIKEWFVEFQAEGPYAEDVAALVQYLQRVVADELDLGKAAGLVRWIAWVVDEGLDESDVEAEGWRSALERVKEGVQQAVRARGLGEVHLE